MGGGASTAVEDVHLDEEVDERAWLTLNFVTDNGVRFNSRTLYIAGISENSLLEKKEERIYNKGYWWEHDHVPTEKDDEDNLNQVLPMTLKKQEDMMYLINQAGLTSSYSEHFACPHQIRSDSVFITIRFVYKSSQNRAGSITSLSGCILKEDLNVPFIGVSDKVTRGAWIFRARELLPGPRFEQVHMEIKNWWNKVERLCEAASTSHELSMRRADFFSLSTKRSQAYAHAVQFGFGTPKSLEHVAMVEIWKEEGEKALQRVSSTLLDPLFAEGKILVAEIIKEKTVAFEKLDALKVLLHGEFMNSLLELGDQIEAHEHDAWANFHLRFNAERRQGSSMVPRRGRKPSVLLIKQSLTIPTPERKKTKRVIIVEDPLLGSCKRLVECDDRAPASSVPGAPQTSPSSSPLMRKKEAKKRNTRVGLAPLEEDEDKTDKAMEERVKVMVLNMTASATQNTTKAKLTKRLALVKAQKTRQQSEAFVIGAKAHFECLLFDLCANAKMNDYMDRERAILENKIFTQISTVKKAQSIQHSKDLGQAIKNSYNDQAILALEVNLQKRKEKLHNKLNHRKERKRKQFDEAKSNTLERLKEKLEDINHESTTATLTTTASGKLKGISLLYKMLQTAD